MLVGFELMLIGMGMVFAFLLLLIGSVNLMSWFFRRFGHLFPEEEKPSLAPAPSSGDEEIQVAIAIAAAAQKRHASQAQS